MWTHVHTHISCTQCMYLCVYTCTYIHVYIKMYVCLHVHIYKRTYFVHIYIYTCICMHICMHAYICGKAWGVKGFYNLAVFLWQSKIFSLVMSRLLFLSLFRALLIVTLLGFMNGLEFPVGLSWSRCLAKLPSYTEDSGNRCNFVENYPSIPIANQVSSLTLSAGPQRRSSAGYTW